jgi:hypothetical protein
MKGPSSISSSASLLSVVIDLKKLNMAVPPSAFIKGQIDTRTHPSGVDSAVLRALRLDGPVDIEPVFTSSTGDEPHPAPVYAVNYTIVGPEGEWHIPDLLVLAHNFGPNEEARATIGRDLLSRCTLMYYGLDNRFTLAFGS